MSLEIILIIVLAIALIYTNARISYVRKLWNERIKVSDLALRAFFECKIAESVKFVRKDIDTLRSYFTKEFIILHENQIKQKFIPVEKERKPKDWFGRLIIEHDELAFKITRLRLFISSKEINKLCGEVKSLLLEQISVMDKYLNILSRRINLYNESQVPGSVKVNSTTRTPDYHAGSFISIKSPYRYLFGIIDEDSNYQLFHFSRLVEKGDVKVMEDVGIVLSVDELEPGMVSLGTPAEWAEFNSITEMC